MPGPKAPSVPLSADERQELLTLIRAHKTPQHFSFRAHIILQLADAQNALRADSGNVRGVLRDQLVVRLRRRCRV